MTSASSLPEPAGDDAPERKPGPQPGPGDPVSEGTSAAWIRHLKRKPDSQTVWGALTGRYQNRILVYAGSLLGPKLRRRTSPEEVVNDAWMRVIQNLDRFEYRQRGSVYQWLCLQVRRVAQDHARTALRRDGAEPRLEADIAAESQVPEAVQSGAGPATEVGRRDIKERLTAALERVPDIYRRVLVAFYLEDKGREEIAAEFGLKPNTVSQQLKRGLDHWREAFGSDLERVL